jgi:outer membrane autotransporter protein
MKKFVIATVIAAAATAASAAEFGVTGTHDVNADRNSVGVTVGNKYGALGVTAGFDRTTVGDSDQNRYSLVASYDVAKLGPFTFDVRGGVGYLDNHNGPDGYVGLVGAGASVPVTKTVSVVADVTRQYGQTRVDQFDGNRVTVGVKYKF